MRRTNNVIIKKNSNHTNDNKAVYSDYAVKFVSVCKNFNKASYNILHNTKFTIASGKITAILGSSGAGKTTIARIINGLETYDCGKVFVNGILLNNKTRKQITRNTAFVFQNFNLFSNMSVLDNIIYTPTNVYKQNKHDIIKKANILLRQFNIERKKNNFPHELSGGQKQRVAIIRALILNPDIFIMDEPTASLDPESTNDVIRMIRDINKQGLTIIVITHDMVVAKKATDNIIFLSGGKCTDMMATSDFFNKNVKKSLYATKFLHNCEW